LFERKVSHQNLLLPERHTKRTFICPGRIRLDAVHDVINKRPPIKYNT